MGRQSRLTSRHSAPYSLVRFAHSGRPGRSVLLSVGLFLTHLLSPPAAPFCPPPACARRLEYLILPPLRSGTTTKVEPRVAARRPPTSAFPAQHRRARGEGGGKARKCGSRRGRLGDGKRQKGLKYPLNLKLNRLN